VMLCVHVTRECLVCATIMCKKGLFSERYCISCAFTAIFPFDRLVNSYERNDLSLLILVM
jgi:hypothetical protein